MAQNSQQQAKTQSHRGAQETQGEILGRGRIILIGREENMFYKNTEKICLILFHQKPKK